MIPIRKIFLSPRRRAGSILILSLWAVVILSIMSMALASFVFQEIRFTSFFMRAAISLPLAKSACSYVLGERKNDKTPTFDSMEELAKEKTVTLCGDVAFKYCLLEKKNSEGKERIIDEGALININTASIEVLKRLPGLDEDLVKAIINSGRRPFQEKHEVLLVEGMDKQRFNQFKDLVTVYGTGRVNINTACPEVLAALGLDEEVVGAIIKYRSEYLGDDHALESEKIPGFKSTDAILSGLKKFISLSLRQEQDILSAAGSLSVKSPYLRLNVYPQIKGKEGIHYSIVINPAEKKIILWQET